MTRLLCPALLLLGTACESGLSMGVRIEVPDEIVTSFDAASPGLIVTDLSPYADVVPVAALCGEPVEDPLWFTVDLGFGCLEDDLRGTEVPVRAWVAPLPEGWDADAACSAVRSGHGPLPVSAPSADTGAADPYEGLAADPEAGWAQGADLPAWRRDGSPCGGSLSARVTLAR